MGRMRRKAADFFRSEAKAFKLERDITRGQGENKGLKGSGVDGKAEALAGSLRPAEGESAKRLECPAIPALCR
ncbi:hypothetical protein ZWY2020_058347 [Hordeum vulgare]|nr:hypothetical protein ZWY2020_058347 [Hordeum vulgare]